ncbi:VWA domain-containing protein [Frankia sp. AgKG'84/4]|uniref:VWA domain-containing protein n=1 Tax=Frankia sp. AgKG'84/4 TaxID=573490 RepID=UPI0027E40F77|nr:VWA domain-containing protein [Frankia sp. AgKG'84/4]
MPRHAHHDPTFPAEAPTGDWLRVSAAMTRVAPFLTGRNDLVVTCAPGVGRGAPAMMIPSLAAIEVNADLRPVAVDPASMRPAVPDDRSRYPALWGAFVHECAHAAHSLWEPHPLQAHTPAAEAANLLEESRAEAAHLGRHLADRRWLRAVVRDVVMPDLLPTPGPVEPVTTPPTTPPPDMTIGSAARTAALILARADAGIVYRDEITHLEEIITKILGEDLLGKLRTIWQAAHQVTDTDTATMMRLGQDWVDLLDEQPDPVDPANANALAQSISDTLERIIVDDERPSYGQTATAGTRTPTGEERAAARRLARGLRAASVPDRVPVTVTSPTPPGRLRMRGALAADAQRAAGTLPTARPFSRTQRRRRPHPPLRLGIAVDVSGSMSAYSEPAASTAWITANAAAAIPDTETATVIFGAHVRPITHPGRAPARVTRFEAKDSYEQVSGALDHLTDTLALHQPGTTRLLVIISDGVFRFDELLGATARLPRLAAAGCHLLWIQPHERSSPLPPAHVVTLTNPADTATAIATAALRALATTR